MKTKTFEIRDRATFIPVVAVKLSSDENENDRYLLGRCGLGLLGSFNIALFQLQTGIGYFDPYEWSGAPIVRTMPVAHKYIEENFDKLDSGAVIDVEFILGETTTPKKSEKFETGPY